MDIKLKPNWKEVWIPANIHCEDCAEARKHAADCLCDHCMTAAQHLSDYHEAKRAEEWMNG